MKIVVDLPEWYLKGIQGIKLPHYVDELIMEGQPLSEVLDEIKAEIDENLSRYEHFSSSNTANGLIIAKKIIEKYKGGNDE